MVLVSLLVLLYKQHQHNRPPTILHKWSGLCQCLYCGKQVVDLGHRAYFHEGMVSQGTGHEDLGHHKACAKNDGGHTHFWGVLVAKVLMTSALVTHALME